MTKIPNQNIIEIFNFRYACKKFNPNKKVTKKDQETILEAGRLSPSSFGIEPWDFVVVQTKKAKAELSETVPITNKTKIKTASFVVIILNKTKNSLDVNSNYIEKLFSKFKKLNFVVKRGLKFVYGKFIISSLKTEEKINAWSQKQTHIPLANMLTTSAMLEIDSIPMEGFYQQKVLDFLKQNNYDISNKEVSVLAAFGYSAEKRPKEKLRRDFEDVVTFL
ncbi:NAD(P)H-dependent oxidoreductase [Candidatus Campbellbacteria bacterium]|nr:MAG: NAD(P)H-dependent oxidoreductase [Candidatus Campbellbacteria bacterium]